MSRDNCTICGCMINTTPYPNHNEGWFVLSDEDNRILKAVRNGRQVFDYLHENCIPIYFCDACLENMLSGLPVYHPVRKAWKERENASMLTGG